MKTIKERLEEIEPHRGPEFAPKQLKTLNKLDSWFRGDLETISSESLGGEEVVRSILRGDCQFKGGRNSQHMSGYENSTDEYAHYTPAAAEKLAWQIAEELGVRAKDGSIDPQHVMFLIPELGQGGAKNAIDVMRRHKVLEPLPGDGYFSQVIPFLRK